MRTLLLSTSRFLVTALLALLTGSTLADENDILNVPPPGFTALFNGRDFSGWRMSPQAKEMWFIEDGVLKSPGLLRQWGADLVTEKEYRDFVLLLDFRMPTLSDSGIMFRRLVPEIPNFGDQEQFNLRSRGGMGHLESYYFLPSETAERMGLKEDEKPQVRHVDPEIGVWHTIKLIVKGRSLSAEFDGELIHDNFVYHEWMLNMQPAPIRLQKHIVVRGDNLGDENPCPIEYRNIFLKELGPTDATATARAPSQGKSRGKSRSAVSSDAKLLARIDKTELPPEYDPTKHQDYVDRQWPKLSPEQVARAVQLWKMKQEIEPDMPNRGFCFVKIMTYVAGGERPPAENNQQKPPGMHDPARLRLGSAPESRFSNPVHCWKWSAATEADGTGRQAIPFEIPKGPTINVVPFVVLEEDAPPVVLLPDSRLAVTGHLATSHPVYFGITVHHPNGDFAGRFVTMRPADRFPSGKEFQATVDFQDFQLDSSLADMKLELPDAPFHFVVESIWLTTPDKEAGLEIAEVNLIPPSQEAAD